MRFGSTLDTICPLFVFKRFLHSPFIFALTRCNFCLKMTILDVDEIPVNAHGHANCGLLVNNLKLSISANGQLCAFC